MSTSADRRRRRTWGLWLVGALAAASAAVGTTGGGPVGAAATGGPTGAVSCNAWVGDSGVDAVGRGTKAAPYRTVGFALAAPQAPASGLWTLCVPGGATVTGSATVSRSSTVFAGDPAGAVPRFRGQLTVTGNDVTVRDLAFEHTVLYAGTVRLWGDRVSLLGSSVTATKGTCVEVGFLNEDATPVDNPGAGGAPHKVYDVVISGNDIGPCARSDEFLTGWTCGASGLPGVYSQWVERLDIVDNVIHDTALRGIQLYPKNDQVVVARNLLRRNSIAMNIGTWSSVTAVGATHQATNITVEDNVFAEQSSTALAQAYPNLRGPAVPPAGGTCAGNKYLLYNSPPGHVVDDEATEYAQPEHPTTTPSVEITGNCGQDVRKAEAASAFTWTANKNAAASFTAGGNVMVQGSACVGYGPDRIQPQGAPTPFEVLRSGPASATIGELVRHEFKITNMGATTRTATITPSMVAAGPSPATVAYRRLEGTGCSTTSCVRTLAAGQSTAVTVVYAAARQAQLQTTATVSAPGVADAVESIATAVGGSFCTAPYGTAGNDTITAPAAFDGTVLCGFEGDDTLVPGKGGDQLRGGDGNDTADYGAASPGGSIRWRIDLGGGTAARIPASATDADLLTSVEHARGTPNDDVLVGSTGPNRLTGGGGNDSVSGGGGDDVLDGGSGNDTLNGGAGNDRLTGGLGIDTVTYAGTSAKVLLRLALTTAQNTGGGGIDTLATLENAVGGSGNDTLFGTDTSNTLNGAGGDDSLNGNLGNDVLLGGAGNDTLNGGGGSDRCDQSTGTGPKTSCES
jgi:hypothetical protein